MGKPLSRPDCLRQNPPCVGKGGEEEDLNIEDCYVPQRSIYDTVRLNEQIDSGSKGSLSSRHFTDRTLPYSHRTLEVSSLCSNGALASSSAFELRGREAHKLDEKMIFDALKLNSDIIRSTGVPRARCQAEKKEHRRSWRMFVPANFMDYANKSESSFVEPTDLSDAVPKASRCRWGTNSLTSEEGDVGCCRPPAEREENQGLLTGDPPPRIRSLSSAQDAHVAEQYGPFYSVSPVNEQKIPLLSGRGAHLDETFKMIFHDVSLPAETQRVCGQKESRGPNCCPQRDLKASSIKGHPFASTQEGEHRCISDPGGGGETPGPGEFQSRESVGASPQESAPPYADLGEGDGDGDGTGFGEHLPRPTQHDSEESNTAHVEDAEAPLSAPEVEVIHRQCSPKSRAVGRKTASRKTRTQAGRWDPVCNGFHSAQVITGDSGKSFCCQVASGVSHE